MLADRKPVTLEDLLLKIPDSTDARAPREMAAPNEATIRRRGRDAVFDSSDRQLNDLEWVEDRA